MGAHLCMRGALQSLSLLAYTHNLVMAGLVPPTRAEALWLRIQEIASAGEGPAIHVFNSWIEIRGCLAQGRA